MQKSWLKYASFLVFPRGFDGERCWFFVNGGIVDQPEVEANLGPERRLCKNIEELNRFWRFLRIPGKQLLGHPSKTNNSHLFFSQFIFRYPIVTKSKKTLQTSSKKPPESRAAERASTLGSLRRDWLLGSHFFEVEALMEFRRTVRSSYICIN